MGMFSWVYSDTERAMLDGVEHNSYLLVPQEFHVRNGMSIKETCYQGYGVMGGYDIYNLVAEWNKEFIPELIKKIKDGEWYCSVSKSDIENLDNYYNGKPISCELRILGIIMACYDEDNERLPYPIKIVEDSNLPYERVAPSKADPNQGWGEW